MNRTKIVVGTAVVVVGWSVAEKLVVLAWSLLVAVVFMLLVGKVHAESHPQGTARDSRVKEVIYSGDDVVKIVGTFGYSTHIEFAADEEIIGWGAGDPDAWDVAPAGSHLFVRPKAEGATTNLTIVTRRPDSTKAGGRAQRVYEFALDTNPLESEVVPSKIEAKSIKPVKPDLYFKVRFRYPDDEATAHRLLAEQRQKETDAQRVQDLLAAHTDRTNWDYYGCGAKDLWPAEVSDDGRFTYFRYPAASEVPEITAIASDGTETRVNGSMRGDDWVVQQTAVRFVLRSGNSVACIKNNSYNKWGVYTPTKTSNPKIERTIKAGAPKIEDVTPISTTAGTATVRVPAASQAPVSMAPGPQRPVITAPEGKQP